MKKVLLFCIILLNLHGKGQQWFRHDAVWHYTYNGGFWEQGFLTLQYQKDSVFAGHKWSQFSNTIVSRHSDPNPALCYNHTFTADPIFLLDTLNIQMASTRAYSPDSIYTFTDTVYDFSKTPGEFYNYITIDGDEIRQVTDTGTVSINGHLVKYQALDNNDTLFQYIGSMVFIHPFMKPPAFWDTQAYPVGEQFRCFSDSALGFYMGYAYATTYGEACDFYYNSIDDLAVPASAMKIFPNPASGVFTLEITAPETKWEITITDPVGKRIWNGQSFGHKQTIDLSGNKTGIYFVAVRSGEETYTTKLLLE